MEKKRKKKKKRTLPLTIHVPTDSAAHQKVFNLIFERVWCQLFHVPTLRWCFFHQTHKFRRSTVSLRKRTASNWHTEKDASPKQHRCEKCAPKNNAPNKEMIEIFTINIYAQFSLLRLFPFDDDNRICDSILLGISIRVTCVRCACCSICVLCYVMRMHPRESCSWSMKS